MKRQEIKGQLTNSRFIKFSLLQFSKNLKPKFEQCTISIKKNMLLNKKYQLNQIYI